MPRSPQTSNNLTPQQLEAMQHMQSIERAPFAARGWHAAGAHLVNLAYAGHDVYAYQAAGSGQWNIWLEGIRLTIEEYAAWFAAYRQQEGGAA